MAADPALDAALEAAVARGRPRRRGARSTRASSTRTRIAALGDPVLARPRRRRPLARPPRRRGAAPPAARPRAEAGRRRHPRRATTSARPTWPSSTTSSRGIALAAGGAVGARGGGRARARLPMVVGRGRGAARARRRHGAGSSTATRGIAVVDPQRAPRRSPRDGRAATARPAVHAATARPRPHARQRRRRRPRCASRSRPAPRASGLLRTELAFLDAAAWPDEAAHRRACSSPCWRSLGGRTATVRVLDFGGDKTPPFLPGHRARAGSRCCSASPTRWPRSCARSAPRRAICACCSRWSRGAGGRRGRRAPCTAGAARRDDRDRGRGRARRTRSPRRADFLSIGTNDLTADVLGADRFAPGGWPPTTRGCSRRSPASGRPRGPTGACSRSVARRRRTRA